MARFGAPLSTMLKYLSYKEMLREMKHLVSRRPDACELWNTQDRYGLPSVGDCDGAPCKNWVLVVTERAGLAQDPERPDVFISGALHGDEQIGPQVTVELARWLLVSWPSPNQPPSELSLGWHV